MEILNLRKAKKGGVNMTKIYIKTIICILFTSCSNYQKLIPNNNKGGYTLEVSTVEVKNDSVFFNISVYDLYTKEPIEKGVTLCLFEDVIIQKKSKYLRSDLRTTPPFFTINSFGYKPIETSNIFLKKGNIYNINVFLEPNKNMILD